MTPLLELRGVSAGYAGAPVVRALDVTIGAGELVALLGANGAGKTTTLRTVSGLLPTLGGEIRFAGRSVRGTRPHRLAQAGLAHVPEDRGLFRSLTVRENLALRRGCSAAAVTERFPALGALLDRRVGLLSGGEQQMVALGRALEGNTRVLLVDEISLGLAPIVVEELLPALRQAAEERGVGVLFVEQHVHMALAVADRAYVLSHGRVVLEGPASELARDPELLASSYLGDAAISD